MWSQISYNLADLKVKNNNNKTSICYLDNTKIMKHTVKLWICLDPAYPASTIISEYKSLSYYIKLNMVRGKESIED